MYLYPVTVATASQRYRFVIAAANATDARTMAKAETALLTDERVREVTNGRPETSLLLAMEAHP